MLVELLLESVRSCPQSQRSDPLAMQQLEELFQHLKLDQNVGLDQHLVVGYHLDVE